MQKFYKESFKKVKELKEEIVKDIDDHIESNIYKHFKFEIKCD